MEYSILSDIGSRRQSNQDYAGTYVNQTGIRIFLLADGMGGHRAGNVASKLAVEDLGAKWSKTLFTSDTPGTAIETWLRNEIRNENENIANLGKLDEYQGMGTTLEAVVAQAGRIISAHVGDSRTYLIRNGEMVKITVDHSLVQELLDAGQITSEEAENHPNKNIITRSLGQKQEVEADTYVLHLMDQDYLLMNSDGLTNMVNTIAILSIIHEDMTMDEKTTALIELANENGGLDNITATLIKFDGGDL